ncbi:MAG: NAD+ synthase [Chlamydiota bacterium]
MRILVAQLNPIIGDLEGNTKKILKTLERARSRGVEIVLFPELTICGYPPEDLLLQSSFIEAMEKCLETIVQDSARLMIFVGLVRRNLGAGEKALLNSAAIIHDGKLLGFYDKCLLPTYDVFDERRYFEPGNKPFVCELKGKKIGVIICEDIWQHAGFVGGTRYARDPVIDLIPHKIDFLLNLSASPYQFQKPDVRVNVCSKAAKTLKCPVILCCQVGGNDQIVFDGYSVYVDEEGKLRQLGAGFEEDEMLIDLDSPACACPFAYDPMRDLYRALVLGVRDYFYKQGFKKGLVGISGGIDSALVACIAVDALGKENVLGINMPSRYSSASSIKDADGLALNLDIPLKRISIEVPFEDFLKMLDPYFEGRGSDTTEENLQARIRGMILMALSNKLDLLVMSTGNKSELALGYCTLYGDMCGGLSVIGDVRKTLVYELARWINREKEIIPKSTIEKPPSAELRPDQKDSDSLPDYGVVDTVLQAYVEDYLSPQEIAVKYAIPIEVVMDLVHRIHAAEYKRRQSAPAIRVSKKAFRIGRSYPIVQGWL